MENFDLLYARLDDMGLIQQEVKQQLADTTLKVKQCIADQRLIAQQVKANGLAVAQLTLRQFEHEAGSVSGESMIADDDTMFEIVFAAQGKTNAKLEMTHQFKTHKHPPKTETLCCSLHLNPKSGWTSVSITSTFTRFLKVFG